MVVVEDVFSCIRVGRVCPTVSLLGSSLNLVKADRIVQATGRNNPRVAIWLDPDAAGKKGRVQGLQLLERAGAECTIIRSDKDPKDYSYRRMVEILNDRP